MTDISDVTINQAGDVTTASAVCGAANIIKIQARSGAAQAKAKHDGRNQKRNMPMKQPTSKTEESNGR